MKKTTLAIAMLATLVACGDEPKSVQYFLEHRDELATRIAECNTGRDTGQECKNAAQAVALSMATTGRKRVRTIEEIEAENARR